LSLFLPLSSSSSTTALAFIFALPLTLLQTSASSRVLAEPNSRAPSHAPCASWPSSPLLAATSRVRVRLILSVSCALRPGRDAHSPLAPRVFRVVGVRARPARLSASDRGRRPGPRPRLESPVICVTSTSTVAVRQLRLERQLLAQWHLYCCPATVASRANRLGTVLLPCDRCSRATTTGTSA
jgi:hypothetical protein